MIFWLDAKSKFSSRIHRWIGVKIWFIVGIFGYRLIAGYGPLERRSIVGAIQRQREDWMRNMAVRDGRIVDAHLLGGLAQGNYQYNEGVLGRRA